MPDRIFPQYTDADQVLESYGGIDFVSSHSLMGRAFTHVAYEDLAVGNVVNSFNAGVFGTTYPYPISLENRLTAQYIIIHKSDDGSSDVVRGYASCHVMTLLDPKFLTFLLAPDGALSYLARQPSVLVGIHLFLQKWRQCTKSPWLVHHLAYSSPPQPFWGL